MPTCILTSSENAVVSVAQGSGGRVPREETGARQTSVPEIVGQSERGQDPAECAGKRAAIVRPDEERGIACHLGKSAGRRGHYRDAQRHGFEYGQAEAFVMGRQDEEPRTVVKRTAGL